MKRELSIEVGAVGAKREVALLLEPGIAPNQYQVTIDGTVSQLDAVEVRPGMWSVIIDGQARLVEVERRAGGKLAVGSGQLSTVVALEDALRKRLRAQAPRAGGASGSGEKIAAPIAGKIVKVLVAVGDTVAVGQPVMVVEAMKMENEIVAERGGVVTKLGKSAGSAIDAGELLVELQ